MKRWKHTPAGFLFNEDILIEIFLWLPLKSLVRFKRLSKRWYFLISDRDSNFRRNYLSTLSSRRRRRIVGSDDDSAMIAGFFYENPSHYWRIHDQVRFLPTITVNNNNNNNNNTNINPFLSLDESLDKFLSCCLHLPTVHRKKFFVAASSNGFLLLVLESKFCDTYYYLLNPVTMEWLALPKREETDSQVYVGFVCKGDYPSLDLVEYTIVRFSWLDDEERVILLFELFSSGDNEWSEYKVSCESMVNKIYLTGTHNTVMVSTTTNKQGGSSGIVVYFMAMVQRPIMATVIVVFNLNKGGNSLQVIETPGPDPEIWDHEIPECADYIREFDDGIHYVRLFRETDFEFWVLNTESGEWYLKHRASLKSMIRYPWLNTQKWSMACVGVHGTRQNRSRYYIHAFHPRNPNLIFLTLFGRFVCYNLETRMLELVYDFTTQENMNDVYYYYVYQWPCWPPLV